MPKTILLNLAPLTDLATIETEKANTLKAKEDLEKLDADIKLALGKELKSQIEELQKFAGPEGNTKINDLLDQATKEIDKDFSRAQHLYNDAAAEYSKLKARVMQGAPKPPKVSDEKWNMLQDGLGKVLTTSNSVDTIEQFNRARMNLNVLAPQEDWGGGKSPTSPAEGNSGEDGKPESSDGDKSSTPPAVSPSPSETNVKQAEVLAVRMPYPKTTRGVLRLITIGDWSRLVVTMLVAVLVGIKLFWMDNSTWGGGNDYIIALVWGFGVDQISSATVGNINSLYSKLQGTGT